MGVRLRWSSYAGDPAALPVECLWDCSGLSEELLSGAANLREWFDLIDRDKGGDVSHEATISAVFSGITFTISGAGVVPGESRGEDGARAVGAH